MNIMIMIINSNNNIIIIITNVQLIAYINLILWNFVHLN